MVEDTWLLGVLAKSTIATSVKEVLEQSEQAEEQTGKYLDRRGRGG